MYREQKIIIQSIIHNKLVGRREGWDKQIQYNKMTVHECQNDIFEAFNKIKYE